MIATKGTEALVEDLKIHPDIKFPNLTEVYFYDRNYDKGLDWYR